MPATASSSARPATSGASGPTTTRSTPCSRATSSGSPNTTSASSTIPAFPGAHSTCGRWGERPSARTSACSRPPEPTTRTFTGGEPRLDRGDEVVDRDRGQRLVPRRPAGPELEGDPSHRRVVGGLDDVDEVEVAERRPLRLDRGAELLDLGVDLLDPPRVVLDGLDALGRERREHDVGRQRPLLHGGTAVVLPRGGGRSGGGARRRLREDDLAVHRVGPDPVALGVLPAQDREGQRVAQTLLEHALQRPRAVRRVVAEVAEQRL